jgi:hypothetical protein
VHHWLSAIALPTALVAIVLPALAALIFTTARGRPTLEQSARRADRLFGTQDLLTSAWEIARSPEAPHPAALLVRQRAQAYASAQLGKSEWPDSPSRSRGSIAGPVALGIIGAFLLLNRGAEPDGLDSRLAVVAGPATADAVDAGNRIAADIAERPSERRERPTVETDGIVVPDPLEDGPRPLLLPDTGEAGAGSGGDLGKLATDDRPPPRLGSEVSLPEMEVRIVSVTAVESAAELTIGSDGVELDESAAAVGASANGGAAAGPTTLTVWNDLPPELDRLAERYFDLSRDSGQADTESNP